MATVLTNLEQSQYRDSGFFVRPSLFSERECMGFRAAAQRLELALLQQSNSAGQASATTEYHLDGNRFMDIGHITVQFEHSALQKLSVQNPDAQNSDTKYLVVENPDSGSRLRVVEPVNDAEPLFDALIDDPRLCLPMKQLVPSQGLALWTAKLNFKHPRVGSGFGWHQDAPYWVHDSDHVEKLPNVMVLFDDASADNGCFRVIEGSHQSGCLPGCEDGRQLQGFYTHPDHVDEMAQVLIEAPAGSAIFFDPHIVHGSGSNQSDLPRRAMIITYQPAGFAALKSGRVREIR